MRRILLCGEEVERRHLGAKGTGGIMAWGCGSRCLRGTRRAGRGGGAAGGLLPGNVMPDLSWDIAEGPWQLAFERSSHSQVVVTGRARCFAGSLLNT